MKIIGVIPARYKSSRFPGKPLELINGVPMIKRVYDNGLKVSTFDEIIIATDDKRISNKCKELNMKYIMTPKNCFTGTDRIAYVSKKMKYDLYVNLQGDEPLIKSETISKFIKGIENNGISELNAFNSMTDCDKQDLININIPKVVVNCFNDLLYISRSIIPYKRDDNKSQYYKELGLHACTKRGLELFSHFKQNNLELSEKIEYLRFLEMGIPVKMIYLKLNYKNFAVDIPEDIKIVEEILKNG